MFLKIVLATEAELASFAAGLVGHTLLAVGEVQPKRTSSVVITLGYTLAIVAGQAACKFVVVSLAACKLLITDQVAACRPITDQAIVCSLSGLVITVLAIKHQKYLSCASTHLLHC